MGGETVCTITHDHPNVINMVTTLVMAQSSCFYLSVTLKHTQIHSLPTLRGGLSRSLVSIDSMASLAPRNSKPDEGSNKKVLKLATPSNFFGARTVESKGEKTALRSLHFHKTS